MEFSDNPVGYNTVSNIRTLIHWFKLWNAREKEAFMKDLVTKAVPNKVRFKHMNLETFIFCNIYIILLIGFIKVYYC